ncbi:hypothetical protein FB379_11747 [Aeribacillus composti]|nr:hypothetical protein FB379_11747 [Aeribacillus composti]
MKNKSANSALKAGRFVDNALTNLKNSIPDRQMGLAMEGIGNVKTPVENTNGLENKVRAYLSEKTGVNLGGSKAGNDGGELGTKGTGNVQTGGRELSIDEYLKKLDKAEEMYESFRKSKTDVQSIAKNTGMTE